MKIRWNIKLSLLLLALLLGISYPWAQSFAATTKPGKGNPTCKGRGCTRVPEIDAGGTLPALALLGGAVALVMERKRRK